jgi:ribose 1,5-bisphosphate isomerase
MDKINQLEKDIKSLKIQGATDIALATLEGIAIALRHPEGGRMPACRPGSDSFQVEKSAERLAYARPTEPLAQNAVRFVFDKENQSPQYYRERLEEYKRLLSEAKGKMANYGASFIQNGGVYLTHCHSSTVVSMFIKARKKGKQFAVIATETRPKYQGRITVGELIKAGFEDVTLIIDDVAPSIIEGRIKHIDGVFIGADLLSQNGFVNKVGSLGIAYAAKLSNIPLYSLSILLKYDPRPYSAKIIEQREGSEIWPDAPTGLQFYAPAFDYVPYKLGVKLICEDGIIERRVVEEKARKLYKFLN